MLAGLRLADPQLRVLPATPMDRQEHFARRLVDVGNDVGDKEGAQEPLRVRMVTLGAFQAASRSLANPAKSGDAAAASGVRTASNRAWQASTRRSAASQLFSSCAAMRRWSGSQAA